MLVVCELFIQWVVEDYYAASRPAWEKVEANSVKDVKPYENIKKNFFLVFVTRIFMTR
ncbi:MAG: hypothetical protein WCR36_03110 [Bacteroidaceae bacterium]